MRKAAIRIARPVNIIAIGRVARANVRCHRPHLSRFIRGSVAVTPIVTVLRQGRQALRRFTEVSRDMGRTWTATGMASAVSHIVGDDQGRKIRIEASVLAALMAIAAMANVLAWLRS